MSSFLSLSNIDFSCSEIGPMVSNVSINSSCEPSTSLSTFSWGFASFIFFFASGDVVVFSSELAEDLFRRFLTYLVSNNFGHVLFVKLEVKCGRQTESSSRHPASLDSIYKLTHSVFVLAHSVCYRNDRYDRWKVVSLWTGRLLWSPSWIVFV